MLNISQVVLKPAGPQAPLTPPLPPHTHQSMLGPRSWALISPSCSPAACLSVGLSGLRFLPCAGCDSVHPKLPPALRVEASEAGHQDVGEELRLLKGREEERELEQQLSRAEDEWTDVFLPPSEQGPLDRAAPACSRAAESPGLGSGSWVPPSPRRTWLTGALSLLRTGFR